MSLRSLLQPAALLIATVSVLITTVLADRSLRDLAELSVRTTAAGISEAAESFARERDPVSGELARVFSDRVVAYALLADDGGRILFHTNPARQGGRIDRAGALDGAAGDDAARERGRRVLLGTGRPAYEFTRPLAAVDGSQRILRVVLYTAVADRALDRARNLWISVSVVLVLFWSAGVVLWRTVARAGELERQVQRHEALALIGEMTTTLAHEIRNAIGGLKGHAQWIDEKTPADDPRKSGFAAILAGTARIEDLVLELLLFSRAETYDPRDLEADDVLASAAAAAVGWKGRVVLRPAPGLAVRADAEKLGRALTNAVRNALEAMGPNGELTLSAAASGPVVLLRVEDDGPGLAPEALGRLFNPFYTTKSGGTGLGLAYARKVIEGQGGSVTLENRAHATGAVFTAQMPRARRGGPRRQDRAARTGG